MDKGFENMALGLTERGGTQMDKIKQKWHTYCGADYWYIIASGEDVIAKIPFDEQSEEIAKYIVGLKEINLDMYEALKLLVAWAEMIAPNDKATEKGIQALAKAEGR